MRLIDADALKKDMFDSERPYHGNIRTTYANVYATIDAAPTIEAESVVRCKDCMYSTELKECEKKIYADGCLFCSQHESVMYADSFCSDGRCENRQKRGGET